MTEAQLRQQYVTTAKKYLGCKESDGSHKPIVDLYNSIQPLPVGYKVKYTDSWCAAYVSAVAQELGLTDIILPECGCSRMINLYKKVNRFQESDNYTPSPGDLIMYDWDDSGSGDNTGGPEHVGIVCECSGGTITVIEGNKNNAVEYRTLSVNGRFIRGYCLPDFAGKAEENEEEPADVPSTIWLYLMAMLGNEYGAAALMGNLEAESNLCPYRVQGDFSSGYATSKQYTKDVDSGKITKSEFINNGPGGGGYGLAQWTYKTRKQALYERYKNYNYPSIGDLLLALDFLMYELKKDYPGVLAVLKSATSIREASDKVLHDFERPADQSTSVEEKRASMGQAWYDKYAGTAPGGGVTPEPDKPWKPKGKNMSTLLLIIAARRSGA